MKYCSNCGKEILDNTVICPHCGCATKELSVENPPKKFNVFALIGFILSFFIPVAGLVLSIIGLKKVPEYDQSGKGFSIAGITISAVQILAAIMSLIIYSIYLIIYLIIYFGLLAAMIPMLR